VIRLGCRPAPHPAHVLLAAQVADAVPQVEQRPHLLGLHLLQQGGERRHSQGIPGEDPLLHRIIEVGTVAADDGGVEGQLVVEGTGRHEVATRHQQHLDVVGPGLGQGRPGSGRDLVIPVQQGTVHVQCNGLITTHITSKNVETGAAPSLPFPVP